MQREKRKLKVKQKRREEKMEKEINMVYLHVRKFWAGLGLASLKF